MRKEITPPEFVNNMSSASSVAPSVNSRRSSRASFNGRGAKSMGATGGTERDDADESKMSGKIIELDDDLDFTDMDSTASMFKLLQKSVRKIRLIYTIRFI